jgi:hypothetical protein
MFQNTMNDMRQCLESMDAAETMAELDLSRTEQRSYDIMRDYCQNFLDCAARLDSTEANGVEE